MRKLSLFSFLAILTVQLLGPSFVYAQDNAERQEHPEIPIYLFVAENGDVLGLAPITEDVAVGCLASSNLSENPQETPETSDCFLLSLAPAPSTTSQTPEAGVERPIFTGHEYDEDTNLHYYIQRYYNQDIGRFTSIDPVFLDVGARLLSKEAEASFNKYLSNPQSLNSYAYVNNNPLIYVDEEGEFHKELSSGFSLMVSGNTTAIGNAVDTLYRNNGAWRYAIDNPAEAGAVTGLVGGAVFLTAVPAVAAWSSSVVTLSGGETVVVTNRLIEGSIYAYLAGESIGSLPNKLEKASEVQQGDLKAYGEFTGSFALDYGPQAFGDTAEAIGNLVQLAESIASKVANLIERQQKQTEDKDNQNDR